MADLFDKARRPVPVSVGTIVVTLKDRIDDTDPPGFTATVQIQALAADGTVVDMVQGNLWPKLTAGQQTALTNFMTMLRTKAAEVL